MDAVVFDMRGATAKGKAKGSAVGAAIDAMTSAVTGQPMNGTVGGKKGFQPGNTYGARAHTKGRVDAARRAHSATHAAVKQHAKKRALATPEGRVALRAAARAARDLQAARAAHGVATKVDRNAASRARYAAARGSGAATDRAASHLAALQGADHPAGAVGAHVDRIARGATKAELFEAAHRSGIDHAATTKAGLVAHLREHFAGAARARAAPDPAAVADRPAGHVGPLRADLIHVDPARFQFKHHADAASGSVGSLHGVGKFDRELAGVLSVWKDPADGKVYVVNGHNRLDLARRLGAKQVDVRFLDAQDARHARARGALQNIAEGNGTSLDSAKFFRDTGLDTGRLAAAGINLKGKVASEGLSLSKLEDGAFRRVVDGRISPERGAIIGDAGLSHAEQRSLLGLLDRRKGGGEVTNAQLREFVDATKAAPTAKTTTRDLFGTSEEETNLALHRAKVAAYVHDRLGKDKRLHGIVSKSANVESLERAGSSIDVATSGAISRDAAESLGVFHALKNRKSAVADALTAASERLHRGEKLTTVQKEAYERVIHSLREI